MTEPDGALAPLRELEPPTTVRETIGDVVVPWCYDDVRDEYGAIRGTLAVLDLTGAGLWHVRGDGAVGYLQSIVSRDVAYLTSERSTMGIMLDDEGKPLDICTIYRTDDGFLVETSIGGAHAARVAEDAPADVDVVDARSDLVLIGFEGPRAWDGAAVVVDEPIDGLPFQGVRRVPVGGREMMVARSGFTGEFGFKIAAPTAAAGELWQRLCGEGRPCGHQALEIAMTEIRQPLLHREVLADGGVLRCGLNWLLDSDKEGFRGRDAVIADWGVGSDQLPVSFVGTDDAPVPSSGSTVRVGDDPVGRVVHAVYSPGVGTACGIARLTPELAASGLAFDVDEAGGALEIRTVSSPLRTPTSWRLASQRSS